MLPHASPLSCEPRGIRAVTLMVADVDAAMRLYRDVLAYEVLEDGRVTGRDNDLLREAWGLPRGEALRVATLRAAGARDGAVRLVELVPRELARVTDGARPWDHGYVKHVDVFTDDVRAQYQRAVALGHVFLSAPFTYAVPWGPRVTATEAHLPTDDGLKLAFARMDGAPRRAFGEAAAAAPFTELAAVTRIVRDYDAEVAFARDVLDCVPAFDMVVDDARVVAGLGLPPATRLRCCFIGPPAAVGGKVGLVAYEGPGVADARALLAAAPPGARGARVLTFDDDEVRSRGARAVVHGATWVRRPGNLRWIDGREWGQSSVRLADGVVLEFVSPPLVWPPDAVDAGPSAALAEGGMQVVMAKGLGRVVVARVRGEVFAALDQCPHLGGPLSAGALHGSEAICPWHAWRVDLMTGRVRDGGSRRVRRLPVMERDGHVWVWPERAGPQSS